MLAPKPLSKRWTMLLSTSDQAVPVGRARCEKRECLFHPELHLCEAPTIDKGAGARTHRSPLALVPKDATDPIRERNRVACRETVASPAVLDEVDRAAASVAYDCGKGMNHGFVDDEAPRLEVRW